MNNRATKVGQFLKAVIKLPPNIFFAKTSEENILFCDPYNDDDIIYYAYIYYSPAGVENNSEERVIHGVRISLLENPQKAFDNINEAIREISNVMAR
jgi:hypothetical protein